MRGVVVAIDLETTGLDVKNDEIIEIGAVRMQEGKIIDEYATLVKPNISIPDRTTLLTGIKPEDVSNAPSIKAVLPDLLSFVGDAPIIGHSVGFDLAFMNKHGVFTSNTPLDTYDLASVLLPNAPRYNLHSLTTMFDIALEDAHRALDDARAAGVLYWQLYLMTLKLPLHTLQAINRAAHGMQWAASATFASALQEREDRTQAQAQNPTIAPQPSDALSESRPALKPNEEQVQLETEAITRIFGADGELAQAMSGYEHRPQQETMARLITQAFNTSEHLIVEAGTGTGKSLAYLIPAFEWASLNNQRVVISTDTIALQDQLLNKDIPNLQRILGINLNASVLKGRSNYLCLNRFETLKRRGPTSIEELRVLAKILVWRLEDQSGDKTTISLRGPAENNIWNRLSSADGEGCRANACRTTLGVNCPFHNAYKQAEASHLLIVNHALLIADAKSENRVLPDYQYIIIDEAHHLEEAVTNSMRFTIDEATLMRRLEDIGNTKRGLLADLVRSLRESDTPTKTVTRVEDYIESVTQATTEMGTHVHNLFKALRALAEHVGNLSRGDYVSNIRIEEQQRTTRSFGQVQRKWHILRQFMEVISDAATELSEVLVKLEDYNIENHADLQRNMEIVSQYLNNTNTNLDGFIEEPDSNTIYWLSVSQDGRQLALHTAPLHVGPLITEHLWNQKQSVILTSATLRTNGNFEHIRERIHAETIEAHEVGSPFDYKSSTMLFLPTNLPEPNEFNRYQKAIEKSVIDLSAVLGGRVMVLFTSYGQLRQTAKNITPRLALGNITVYDQSDGTSRQSLLENFKSTERAVLLGTRSFWEGVDIPGDDLSALIITRLPFPVPSDPIFAARSDTYQNSFNDYAVPEAILRFRQGFGRLIRTNTDRGIVVIMDARITSKRYGSAFLDALPDCTIKQANIDELSNTAREWLNIK